MTRIEMIVVGWALFLFAWFHLAMWHLSRRHQIREKSSALYYGLLAVDAVGYVADVLANFSWASALLLDLPASPFQRDAAGRWRFSTRELTVSQHMHNINSYWDKVLVHASPTRRQRWSHWLASEVCSYLNRRDPDGHHC